MKQLTAGGPDEAASQGEPGASGGGGAGLPASRELLDAIHRSVADHLCTVDVAGRVTGLGPRAAELVGWSPPQADGRHLHDLLHPPGVETRHSADDCPLTIALRGTVTITGEADVLGFDGRPFSLRFSAVPVVRRGVVTGAVINLGPAGDVRRIDDMVRETRQLRDERRRLSDLEKVKSRFLNLAAHELRGPLTVARGYLAMLADGSFGPVTGADLRTAVPVVSAKLSEMAALVDQMLEIARLEEGRFELSIDRLDLRQVVHDALRIMAPLAQAHRLLVVWSPDELIVNADRSRLTTILTNLIDNACKYSPAGRSVEVVCWKRDGLVGLDVRDEGYGIAEADMDTLFTRFGRVVTTENSHIPGSGLGLYLCREIARLLGGELSVVSAEGSGSTFTLRLPAADEGGVVSPDSRAADPGRR